MSQHASISFRTRPQGRPRFVSWMLFAALAAGVLVADQASKWAAVSALTDTMEGVSDGADSWQGCKRFYSTVHPQPTLHVTVDPNWFHFRYVENPGAAWGFLSRSMSAWRTPFFLVVSVSAMTFILVCFGRTTHSQKILRVALGLVFGGALGNFIDRTRLGYVIDFIDWHWRDAFVWPTFNIADAAISIGVILLLLTSLAEERREQRPERIEV